MITNSNFQLLRFSAWHWLIIAALFCAAVVLWLGFNNWLLGLGAFSTFFTVLLFAGQLLSKRSAEEGSFMKWNRTDQVIFCLSLVSTVVTSGAYWLALPAMFAC